MTVRHADASDSKVLAELLEEAATNLGARRGGEALHNAWLGPQPSTEVLDQTTGLIGDRPHAFFIDTEGLGVSLAWIDGSVGWVSCYVRVDARRRGVGPGLMVAAIGWLDGRCEDVDALALPGDRDWKSLLEQSGFKARLLTLRRNA